MSIDSDLAAMLVGEADGPAPWGTSTVVINGLTTRGELEMREEIGQDRGGDPVLVRRTVLIVLRSLFLDASDALTVSRGDVATVDDVAYTISDFMVTEVAIGRLMMSDGRVLELHVKKV